MEVSRNEIESIISNAKDIADLASNIECVNQMIATEYHTIVKLDEINYDDGDVCEELTIDGVECWVVTSNTAKTIRDLIIADKLEMIADWNSEIVDMKNRMKDML